LKGGDWDPFDIIVRSLRAQTE